MNRLLWIIILILLEGCSHMTSFEKCSKDDEWKRFGGMDQCVTLKEEDRKAHNAAIDRMFNWKPADTPVQPIQTYQPTNCQSFVSGNMVNTSCY